MRGGAGGLVSLMRQLLIMPFGTGRARPHPGHESENGGCPNSCRASHFCVRSYHGRRL